MMHAGKTNICIYCKAEGYENGVTYSTVSESVASVIHGIFSQASMPFTLPLCYPCFSVTPFLLSANRSGAAEQVRQTQQPLDQCLTEIASPNICLQARSARIVCTDPALTSFTR